MTRKLTLALLLAVLSLSLNTGCAALQQYSSSGNGNGAITTQTVVKGLYEALSVGSKRAVGQTSKTGGFLNNPLIKINMPPQLQQVMSTLRKVGLDKQVDNLVTQMNHAAEQATGEAIHILVDTVKHMTIKDAWNILNGDDTAATEYFRANTTRALANRFRPIVDKNMKKLGVYNIYNKLDNAITNIPFLNVQGVDLEQYVVNKALSGLFTTIGQQEKKIRDTLSFRTTPVLKQVFGYLQEQRAQGKKAVPTTGRQSGSSRPSSGINTTHQNPSTLPPGTFR